MAEPVAVQRWLIGLGRLTAAARSEADAESFVEAMAPMLAMRFPDEAFTTASLEAVAAECKYLPTYGELVALLRDWWRDNRPRLRALPAPTPIRQRGEPTVEESAHVARVTADTLAALRSSAQPPQDQRPLSRFLSEAQLRLAYEQAGVRGPQRRFAEETAS